MVKEAKTIKVRGTNRAGFFGIGSFDKSVITLGVELGDRSKILTESEQEYFEKALNLRTGELAPHSKWWDDVFNVEHAIRLRRDKTNELTLDTPINELKHKILLFSTKVANSEIDKNKPGISFYIDDIEGKAKQELETLNFEFEGMKMILSSSVDEKRGNLRMFGKKGVDLMSENVLNAQLALEMKKNPKAFFEVMNDKNLKTKAFIKELEEKHIITRKNNAYYNGEDIIASSTEECVEYFDDIKNQELKLKLTSKLKRAKKEAE